MNSDPFRPSLRAAAKRAHASLIAFLCSAPLAAQDPLDLKTAPVADPVKGMHDMTPMSPAEMAARQAARPPYAADRAGVALPRALLFDRPGDGRLWAGAPAYKASFGPEGFVYVPFFGSHAERNYPVRFVLRAVRVGTTPLPLPAAEPVQDGQRVTFDRGAVREVYDLDLEQVEQTFIVDTTLAGDVEVELEVVTELREDAALAGIQFGNQLGRVHYGQAHVVDGRQLRPVATAWEGNAIRIRVPAAARGTGPLIVDPIIHTSAFTAGHSRDSAQPDIAYDASADRYMVVWQHLFSASDIDVYCEFRNGDGTAVAGSAGVIDITTLSHSNPRVANLNANDLFLVTMQRFEAGLWQIFGRRRLANSTPDTFLFAISDPLSGHCVNADVGGDSGSGDQWLVVWERQLSAFDFDIHARRVRADTFQTSTILIDNSAATIHSLPQVSQSNGNGFTASPRWLVVYQFRFSATDEDIHGAVVAQNGTIAVTSTPIDTSGLTDLVPCVSTPNTTTAGSNPLFLVTYERQSPLEARARLLSTGGAGLVNQITPVSLTAAFGLGPYWVRPECDGNRFAVLTGSATISVATLAYAGTTLVLHEAPQPLPGTPSWPRLCSKRSGGGTPTDYGIAYVEESATPDRINVSAYRGHIAGSDIVRRTIGCNGLGIDVAGRAFLGESLTFTQTNTGIDVPGHVLGFPAPASNAVCASCAIGIATNGPTAVYFGSAATVSITSNVNLVGLPLAMQGFAFGSGPCIAQLRFSDTIDFTIR